MATTAALQTRCDPARLESLYPELAGAWNAHQRLRTTRAPVAELAGSTARPFGTRVATGSWRTCNRGS